MPRKRPTDVQKESPPETPQSDVNGTAEAPAATQQNGNYGVVVKEFRYPVSKDTDVAALIRERTVTLRDQSTFVTHEVNVQKIWTNQQGEEKVLYNFRGSELYAVVHALEQAQRWILDKRAKVDVPF